MLLLALLLSSVLPPGMLAAPEDLPESRAGDVRAAEDLAPALTALLRAIVQEDGRVRYDLVRGRLSVPFRRVLKAVETFDAGRLRTHEERMAFWINAYNVQMLQSITETPGVRDILGDGYGEAFFQTPFLTAGRALTLDEIEHVILRRQPGDPGAEALRVDRLDPRIHVALNCAAVSCPRLRPAAFTAATLDADLNAAMRDFTASPHHFRVEGQQFILSSLLDWFAADFDATGQPAGDWLLAYMPPGRSHYARLRALLHGRTAAALRTHPDVAFAYDWRVNAAE